MSNNIQLHKNDLPDDLKLGNIIAVDGEFMGLNVRRDPLCLIQISSGKSDAHIVQFDRNNYQSPNLVKLLSNEKITKITIIQFTLSVDHRLIDGAIGANFLNEIASFLEEPINLLA